MSTKENWGWAKTDGHKCLVVALIGCTAILLSACIATTDSAKKSGGIELGATQIRAEFSGLTARAQFLQETLSKYTMTFRTDGELTMDDHTGGRWHPDNQGRLCLEWPDSLSWNHPGYCFAVFKQGRVIGLFDRVVNQERIRITLG